MLKTSIKKKYDNEEFINGSINDIVKIIEKIDNSTEKLFAMQTILYNTFSVSRVRTIFSKLNLESIIYKKLAFYIIEKGLPEDNLEFFITKIDKITAKTLYEFCMKSMEHLEPIDYLKPIFIYGNLSLWYWEDRDNLESLCSNLFYHEFDLNILKLISKNKIIKNTLKKRLDKFSDIEDKIKDNIRNYFKAEELKENIEKF